MIKFKRLSEVSFETATALWNAGFEGYQSDVNMTVDMYAARMGMEGLSPLLSLVAFAEGKPVGFVLNGIRTSKGRKVAWNGGTGVAKEVRGQGVGRALIEESLRVYAEAGVEVATLEALSNNLPAIKLYEKLGYRIAEPLALVERDGAFDEDAYRWNAVAAGRYEVTRGMPQEAAALSFYDAEAAWQCQWESVRNGGEAVFVRDGEEVVGYALVKRRLDEAGKTVMILLLQCVVHPQRADGEAIRAVLLAEAFGPAELACKRRTFNLSTSDSQLMRWLEANGFTPYSPQVRMVREM